VVSSKDKAGNIINGNFFIRCNTKEENMTGRHHIKRYLGIHDLEELDEIYQK